MNNVKIVVSEELWSDSKYTCKTVLLKNRTLPEDGSRKSAEEENRVLSYSECGNLETGHPVLFFYGLMCSSLITVLAHEQALQHNLRLIAIDYPGVGESTLVEGHTDRTLENWAADVEQFCYQILQDNKDGTQLSDPPALGADVLLPRFSILGHSIGGPHALAVWARMSPKMNHTIQLTLVAPWVGATDTNPWYLKHVVQKWLPETIQRSYVPSVAASFLVGSSYLIYPFGYVVGKEKQVLLRAIQQVHSYNRCQGSVGNRELVRLALEAASKESFWDPLLSEIAALCQDGTGNTDKGTTQDISLNISIFQGSVDKMVSPDACKKLVAWLEENGCHVDLAMIENADHDTILLDSTHMASIFSSLQQTE